MNKKHQEKLHKIYEHRQEEVERCQALWTATSGSASLSYYREKKVAEDRRDRAWTAYQDSFHTEESDREKINAVNAHYEKSGHFEKRNALDLNAFKNFFTGKNQDVEEIAWWTKEIKRLTNLFSLALTNSKTLAFHRQLMKARDELKYYHRREQKTDEREREAVAKINKKYAQRRAARSDQGR